MVDGLVVGGLVVGGLVVGSPCCSSGFSLSLSIMRERIY